MPLTMQDVEQHRKGLNPRQKKQWFDFFNTMREKCVKENGSDCERRAIAYTNSQFKELSAFNPTIKPSNFEKLMTLFGGEKNYFKKLRSEIRSTKRNFVLSFIETLDDIDSLEMLPIDKRLKLKYRVSDCVNKGGDLNECADQALREMNLDTLMPDSEDGEYQCPECMMKEKEETPKFEMEIFRAGTHNGDEFTEQDLQEIADNFQALKDEVRPKLKMTHRENQQSLAGLASYGDVEEVYVKADAAGEKRLYAKVANVPPQVLEWIQNRRFPERSIEIYPQFKLGTKQDAPTYKNVLKAIALLGSEMPAVTGMAPISLPVYVEQQKTVCFQDVCFPCEEKAFEFLAMGFTALKVQQQQFKSKIERG